HPGASAGRSRGAQRAARRLKREGARGLPQGGRTLVDRAGESAERPEGRLLHRGDREIRQARHRGDRRHRARGGEGLSLAEVDAPRRADMIRTDAKTLAFAQGLEVVEDEGLLAEVAGLVEWPVVLMGAFDKEFLEIPEEVIRATIRNNQKCLVTRDPATAKLS